MFEWTEILVLPLGFIGLIVLYGIKRQFWPDRYFPPFLTTAAYWTLWLAVIVAIQVIAIFGSYAGRTVENAVPPADEATAQFGLESGTAYPLVLGSRIGGSYIEGSLRAGFFSASADFAAQPASSYPVKFTTENQHGETVVYTLEVPMSSTTAKLSDAEDASIVFHIAGASVDAGIATRTRIGSDCSFRVVNLFVFNRCESYRYEWEFTENGQRRGLGPIVQSNLVAAEVTLPQELYERLIGQLN